MYNGGEGKWIHIQDIVELRCGRPGPKKNNTDPLNDVRDMEAMTLDNNQKTGNKSFIIKYLFGGYQFWTQDGSAHGF